MVKLSSLEQDVVVTIHPMAASHGLQVAVQSVKAMPDNKVPEIWGESVTQQGAKIAVEFENVCSE